MVVDMANNVMKPQLWIKRPVSETMDVYADWADSYDTDVADRGYVTPARIATALQDFISPGTPILDYGCGTGLSGLAMHKAGLGPIHGTDISPEMLAHAEAKGIYAKLWTATPGEPPCGIGAFDVIVATGVVSLGAAPPECLDLLLDCLNPDGLLAFSFNDPTLEDGSYDVRLSARIAAGDAKQEFRAHGPHLVNADMGADVIIIRRT